MGRWLLRFEASDFDNTVFDSQQLSAIRGASLTFLNSTSLVRETLERAAIGDLRQIYAGASQGAFTFSSDQADAHAARDAVEAALRRNDMGEGGTGCHAHMVYVTALVEGTDRDALCNAEAICNAKKLQDGVAPLPEFSVKADKPGSLRDPRPARPGANESAEIIDRMEYGRGQRQSFYEQFLKSEQGSPVSLPFDFTDDFHEIIRGGKQLDEADLPLSLQNKMAVFYADGNKLNRHRREVLNLQDGLAAFSKLSGQLLDRQKVLLRGILDYFSRHFRPGESNAWFYRDKGADRARFETLLWGGDEVMFVLPSWLALEFAAEFFDAVEDFTVNHGNEQKPLTFSAAMVICDRKTPIRLIKQVADKMVEEMKEHEPEKFGANMLQIEVFESLTLPGDDISGYRRKLYYNNQAERMTRNWQSNWWRNCPFQAGLSES
jgi:hypothetical protein